MQVPHVVIIRGKHPRHYRFNAFPGSRVGIEKTRPRHSQQPLESGTGQQVNSLLLDIERDHTGCLDAIHQEERSG